MKLWFVRSLLLLALPFVLTWAFLGELLREIRSAFWHARQEARIELEAFRRCWRDIRNA